MGFTAFLSLYALVLFSGTVLASDLELRGALGKLLMAITFASAQLLLSIQVLSLFRHLNGPALLLLNAAFSVLIGTVVLTRRRVRLISEFRQFATYPGELLRLISKHPRESITLAVTFAIVVWFVVLAFAMFPMADTYHLAMPIFWKQHATILPYPVANPRLTSVVFASEALCFPSQLYLNTDVMIPALSGAVILLIIWILIALAVRVGASLRAAICAGVTLMGYGSAAIYPLTGGAPDMLIVGMWFAASLYFLLESRSSGAVDSTTLGCSVLCLLMACGTKTVVVLQLPAYALASVLLLGRELARWRVVRTIVLWGAAGLICSSVLWSYTSNLLWFGTFRGHVVLSETASTDMRPASVWTRIGRGSITSLLDPVWLPGSYLPAYTGTIRTLVRWTGAQAELPEDQTYYAFSDESLRPGKGMGLVGLFVLVPGLIVGTILCFRRPSHCAENVNRRKAVLALLVVLSGSILTFYAVLRWQQVGLTRMMLPILVAGIPLCGLLLDNRRWRVISLALVLLSVALYSVYGIAMAARRIQISPTSKLAQALSRIQRDRSIQAEYQWQGEAPGILNIRESYTLREVYQFFLSRVPAPASIGVIGDTNTEEYFLFGKGLPNKLIPLVDCRTPGRLLPVPEYVDYIVVQDYDIDGVVLRNYPGFELWLRVQQESKTILAGLRRRSALPSRISASPGSKTVPGYAGLPLFQMTAKIGRGVAPIP